MSAASSAGLATNYINTCLFLIKLNDCSNVVWRWGNTIMYLMCFIVQYKIASYKYVNNCVPMHLHIYFVNQSHGHIATMWTSYLLCKLENHVRHTANKLFIQYSTSVYTCTLKWWKASKFNYVALCRSPYSRLGCPISGPHIYSSLPTSGSDEPNLKHVLHTGSPDRWDNITLLMTEKERHREGERCAEGKSSLLKGLLVLNSSTLSCRRFWGSYYRKAARLCLHMEYPQT